MSEAHMQITATRGFQVLAMGGAPDDDGIDAHSMRSKIVALERAMFDINDGESNADSCPLTHHFAPGVYGREILLPKGVRVVGKIHRHAHLNVVVSGRAMVATEFGKREVKGGDIFVSEPGAKRAVHALEDTVWMTIHPNESNTQDMSAIEEYVIAPDYGAIGMQAPELLEVT